jgi:hypothetical protein
MTLSEYLGLITSWHADKPRFVNTVAALLQPLIDSQAMFQKLTADFDLDTAVGVQLDMVGQWIGRTRYVDMPLAGKFFSFNDSFDGTPGDSPNTGFNKGVWLGKYDTTDGISRLDDETYRTLLKLQAIANHWDGTIPSIADDFDRVFPGAVIDDKGDTVQGLMSMDVLVPAVWLSSLMLAVLEQDFMLKPSGVRVNFIETTVSTEPLFGFNVPYDAANPGPIAGFNIGAWGKIILTT